MPAIDIGFGAANYSQTLTFGYTVIDEANPANGTGILDTLEFWFNTQGTGVKAGTFSNDGSNKFTNRDVEIIGTVAAGSKQTFGGLNCDVVLGDLIGIFYTAGLLELNDTAGTQLDFKLLDQFGAGQQTYATAPTQLIALYGTGVTSVSIGANLFFCHA